VQATLQLPGDKAATEVLTAELPKLPADNQILVIQALGKRADAAALPALFALAKGGEKAVRLAAIRAMPQIGDASAMPVLIGLFADADRQVSEAAQESLAGLPGDKTDAAIMAMFNSGDTAQRLTALELIGRRRMTASVPALLKAAGEADPKVRPAALKVLGDLGGPDQLPAVLDLLMRLKESQDLSAAEQAARDILARTDKPQSYTDKLIDLLSSAQPTQKNALLRILSTIGGADALKAVRAAVNDSDAEVRATAIRALGGWKGADAAPDLLQIAKTSPDQSQKIAALRGYIGLVRDESLSTDKKLMMVKEAAGLIQRDEEKKLLLGVLGEVPAVEALSMAMEHLSNAATKDEAAFAAVAIAEKIFQEKPSEVTEALKKVVQATDNKDVVRRAKTILNKAKKSS